LHSNQRFKRSSFDGFFFQCTIAHKAQTLDWNSLPSKTFAQFLIEKVEKIHFLRGAQKNLRAMGHKKLTSDSSSLPSITLSQSVSTNNDCFFIGL